MPNGLAYGGGLRVLAASQSNGVDALNEGLVIGEMGYTILVRGGVGRYPFFLTGVEGEACADDSLVRGELIAWLVWASRLRDDMMGVCGGQD